MCGICGNCSTNRVTRLSEQTVREMAQKISHRGPDGDGFYTDDNVVLGHRRLSIIDLEGGDQPIFNEDGTIAVVFNGEIYNYKEIRDKLRRRGHQLTTDSDTEVLVHLYEDMGPDLVDELNGMFAFAIWDSNTRTLLAARDRMGEKPFYYQLGGDGALTFASELKALLHPLSQMPNISSAALCDYLAYGYVPAPGTIFEGISKLPPAHRLVWKDGRTSIERYWSPQDSHVDTSISEQDALIELESLLQDSVRLRLRSDVPVGAFLSGGIDSSLVVGVASQLLETPLQTYVIAFDEDRFDESRYAAEVARVFGTDHHEITVRDLSLDILPQLVAQFDEPFADPSSLPTYYVTRAAAESLKVCLSGDGADELFGGYTRYFTGRPEQVARVLPAAVRKTLFGGLAANLPGSVPGVGFLSRIATDGADHYQRKVGIFSAEERHTLMRSEMFDMPHATENIFSSYFEQDDYDDVLARLRADQETYLPDDILVKVDRNSMFHSLEVRVPFIDHRIVDFANKLPMHLKTHNNIGKYVLRKLLGRMLPSELIDRPKHGFSVPINRWFREEYATPLQEQILSGDSKILDFLNRDMVQQLYDTHKSGRRDRAHQLWALLWLEQWFREVAS